MDLFLINLKQTVFTMVLVSQANGFVLLSVPAFTPKLKRIGLAEPFNSRAQEFVSDRSEQKVLFNLDEAIKDMVFMVCLLYSRLRGYVNFCR